jgi:hypothetical protein
VEHRVTTVQDVIERAEGWVGFVEGPRDNETPFGAWYGLQFQPYCAMALSMWSFEAGLAIPASTNRGYAYTPSGAAWFRGQGRWGSEPRRGAHVFFRFSGARIHHVGLVTSEDGEFPISTIEANTSRGSAGSQRDGGGVWRRRRASGIVGYGYPAYTRGAEVPEEEEMIVPIHIAPGESKVFHVEPPDGSGHIGAKEPLVVLTSHAKPGVRCWVYAEGLGERSPKSVEVGSGRPLIFRPPGGWLHIRNEGSVEVGGQILYRR